MTRVASTQPASAPLGDPPPPSSSSAPGCLRHLKVAPGSASCPATTWPNPLVLCGGGILSPCLDVATGPTLSSLGRDGFFVTESMSVSSLWKTEPGRALVGEATAERAGQQQLYVEARPVRESSGAEVTDHTGGYAECCTMQTRATRGTIVVSVGRVETAVVDAAQHVTKKPR